MKTHTENFNMDPRRGIFIKSRDGKILYILKAHLKQRGWMGVVENKQDWGRLLRPSLAEHHVKTCFYMEWALIGII
jgi:hypothetical protein